MLIPPKYVPGRKVTVLLPMISTAPQNVYVPALKAGRRISIQRDAVAAAAILVLAGIENQAAAIPVEVDAVSIVAGGEGHGSDVAADADAAVVDPGRDRESADIAAPVFAAGFSGLLSACAGAGCCAFGLPGERVR